MFSRYVGVHGLVKLVRQHERSGQMYKGNMKENIKARGIVIREVIRIGGGAGLDGGSP